MSSVNAKYASNTVKPVFPVLYTISASHLLNDMIQSFILAIYPVLKGTMHLSFAQIGLITLVYQLTASILQPIVGLYTDHHPKPYALPVGMGFTLIGLLLFSFTRSYPVILTAAAVIGMGSSIFHPESSRVARMASGGQFGLAQSIFQVGGNAGSSLGPLFAALFVSGATASHKNAAWLSLAALLAIILLNKIAKWYKLKEHKPKNRQQKNTVSRFSTSKIIMIMCVLLILIFSKYFYIASLSSYYTFYLIHKFQLDMHNAQLLLFVFLLSVAIGTLIGGPIGDRIGRKYVIWISILGVAPFTLLLPYANLHLTVALTILIGLTLASAFSAILVYAQDIIPGKVGTISGLFFGLSFGMGGIGAAALGWLADRTSIEYVYHLCSFLPLLGILTVFLPNLKRTIQ